MLNVTKEKDPEGIQFLMRDGNRIIQAATMQQLVDRVQDEYYNGKCLLLFVDVFHRSRICGHCTDVTPIFH
jgi:hypothetical protein